MTRLVHAELLKLWTTRTARIVLALAAAGTAALTVAVLALAGRPGQPALGDDALRQLVGAPSAPLTLAALLLGILGMAGELRHGTATPTFLVPRGGAGWWRPSWPPPPSPAWPSPWWRRSWSGHRAALAPGKGVHVPLADPGLAARVAGLAATVALHAVLGTGLGAMLGNQFAAVVAGLLLWQGLVEDLLAGLLGRPGLARWLPEGAAAALTAPGHATLAMWAGGLVLAAYGLALAVVGGRLVVSRDLT